ncbi:MAG: hypothetical protein NC204_04490 [Candidatus Amulumruptor caecigallinarius]|nr:hypothetical protein [Candidatus Amulumruptor caecigallinarius]
MMDSTYDNGRAHALLNALRASSLFCLASMMCPSFAFAGENLLEGAIVENSESINNTEQFYRVWTLCDKNGAILNNSDATLPYSCFVETFSDFAYFKYRDTQISVQGPGVDIKSGEFLAIFSVREAQQSYSFPISVTEEDNYVFSGIARNVYGNGYGSSGIKTDSFMSENGLAVAVFAESLPMGPKNFAIVQQNGKNVLKVTDNAGNEFRNVHIAMPRETIYTNIPMQFSGTVHLTPADKYITIYCPTRLNMMGRLSLVKETEMKVKGIMVDTEDTCDVKAEYYDLAGRRISTDHIPAVPGIYIRKSAAKTEKIIIGH